MLKLIRNEKGVALMLVLGSLLILTTLVVEFAYNSHVSYELVATQRDRLKAYYLARSAYNLVRLELKFEKDLRVRYASLLKDLPGSGVSSDPLCKQLPLSTGLLKGIASGDLMGAKTEEGEDVGGGEIESGAGEFLSFDGDFEVLCDTEERRINLNAFRPPPAGLTAPPAAGADPGAAPTTGVVEPAVNPYESQKELLFSLMSQKEFEPIFKGKPDEVRKVVTAIADWVDADDRINEGAGISGGAEDSEYTGLQYHYKVKNGKYATVAELLLVAGVGDDLYRLLEPQVTVYGDARMNLCQASDEMVKAFILRYVQTTPGIAPISPGDEEKWASVVEAVKTPCDDSPPKPAPIAASIAAAIGAPNPAPLAALISTTNRFYRIESTGIVGESTAKIVAILDTASDRPNLWKTVYFRVE